MAHLARPEKSKATLTRWLFCVYGAKLSVDRYLNAYRNQKYGAAKRGVEFLLTFKQWCDFWGADIDRRGTGPDDLQMQRIGDSGPYAIGNIKKGRPRQNAITMGLVRRTRNTAMAAEIREAELDFLMTQESGESTSDDDDGLPCLGYASMIDRRYSFAVDKGR